MKRNSYYPSRQADQVPWLTNFSNKLPGYATALDLGPGVVSSAVVDCGWLAYLLNDWLPGIRTWTTAATETVAAAQTGATGNAAMTLPVFTPPALPAGVLPVAPGALTRLFALVQLIKDGGKCTDTIASDLGILGLAQTAPDLATLRPELGAAVSGNQVAIKWGWGGNAAWLDSCEIHVDRGDGQGYRLLTIDSTPNYIDTEPFPATRSIWTYKAIYRANDTQAGLWSNPVTITVPT